VSESGQSSFLILLFLWFVALIVVVQIVPAMILIMEVVSGLARGKAGRKRMVLVAGKGKNELSTPMSHAGDRDV
jgi:hypothetical protein